MILLTVDYSPSAILTQINSAKSKEDNLFFDQKGALLLESPDLDVIQENSLAGISAPQVFSPKVLGAIFGVGLFNERKEIIEYEVEPGDTLSSIVQKFEISLNTLLWTNDLNKNSKIRTGQKLIILPTDGIVHHVKSGDTVSEIAKKYKGKIEEIIAFNELSGEADIYIGDILIVPNGQMSPKPPAIVQVPVGDSYFIFPAQGKITQGIHWYNAVDIGNKCGTPVVAAAGGAVQRAGFIRKGGNRVTILHPNDVVTYYGHLSKILVSPGQPVSTGEIIGYIGDTGYSTGCHLHFGVSGAKNYLNGYPLGAEIKYK